MLLAFSVENLLQLFHRIQNQRKIFCVFNFIPNMIFLENFFEVILLHFANFEAKRTQNTVKNQKTFL
jgi:hypothetical protein